MASIEIDRREFIELVGEEIENEKLIEEGSFMGVHWHSIDGNVCDVETYPNRPDCLSVEGLARAYRGFFEIETGRKNYTAEEPEINVEVDSSVSEVRPFIGGSVIRDVELSEKKINGLIQLQEKMHETMGRRRDKLAIGLHDLSELEPPFTYKAVEPESVSFKPLEKQKQMQLGEILGEHKKGKEFSWILEDEEKYPVIVDSEDQVLSFPPIINNQLTEVEPNTTDVFIDVTGKHRETVQKALNILATALEERGGTIEKVRVDEMEMPNLEPEEMVLDEEYFRSVSGIDLDKDEIVQRLQMMKYGARKNDEGIMVEVPCYRTDVMHQYDLIEDVVIAHGYDSIEPETPEVDQEGGLKSITELSDLIRDVMTDAGAMEAYTHALSSEEKLFDRMERNVEGNVKLENALTEEYSTLRSWLLPSMLEVLKENKHRAYPQEFFETADVSKIDESATGASNKRKLAFIVSDSEVDYTDAKQKLQVLERDLGIDFEIKEDEKSFMRTKRSADVFLGGEKIGFIGELDSKVLENWKLEKKAAGFELDLERLRKLK
ncbi:MAG: phenylalanine--tRNA ligase subunit beta [Nanohaloarchaea archaeon]|nr:phenylalanine--tRNA ligase subunit beta [Candidatus Nanohaloarchaea archaeon]